MVFTYANGDVKQTPVAVNGIPLPCPSEMGIGKSGLHANSERTASGILVSDKVRSNVVKLELKWNFLAAADYVRLENTLSGDMWKNVAYVEANGQTRTITMYRGDISMTPHRVLSTGRIDGYLNVSVNLIQR